MEGERGREREREREGERGREREREKERESEVEKVSGKGMWGREMCSSERGKGRRLKMNRRER